MMNTRFLLSVFVAATGLSLVAEEPYQFRERLECVHEKGRRDAAAVCAADEFELKDGFEIAVPMAASDFVYRVARDFEDYLSVSMGVSARVTRGRGMLEVDEQLPDRQYEIRVDDAGFRVLAHDERAIAQAFYHLEDLMNLRCGPFLKKGAETRTPRFAVRMTHSGYRLSDFPDAHLSQLAHAGMTAIMLFLQDVDVVEGTKSCDVRALIRRAKAFGLDTYLYSCIPTFIHPDDGDAAFDESYGRIAGTYPEAKGLIIVGESCQFPSKDPRVQPRTWKNRDPNDKRRLAGWFPCTDYPDWVRAVQRALAKKAPDMKLVFWTYNWGWAPEKDRLALIDALPRDVVLQATFEMFERQVKRNGLESPTADYSLSFAGPGRYFASEAAAAKKHGLALFTQANAGGRTWDFGTAPYEPFPFQWQARWNALVRAHEDWGLSGIMENHHYGWTPTFIAELEKEVYTEGGIPFDEHLRKIATRDFGAKNADRAIAAWKAWSDAIRDYVPTDLNQYGPFRCGPAYPYAAGRGTVDAKDFPVTKQSFVGAGYIRMDYLKHGFVPELTKEDSSPDYMRKEIELLGSMVGAFESGARDFGRMKGAKAAAMSRLGHYLAAVCRTARNVKRGAVAECEKDEKAILAAARDEYANALAVLPLVEADSHLGWEPQMDYVGGPDQIRWKLGLMEKLYGKENLK